MDDKKKSANMNDAQRTLLIDLPKSNEQLLSGKFSPSFTMKDATSRWQQIAEKLNSIPGTNRDCKSWKKVIMFVHGHRKDNRDMHQNTNLIAYFISELSLNL